jgi:hypothetical protein
MRVPVLVAMIVPALPLVVVILRVGVRMVMVFRMRVGMAVTMGVVVPVGLRFVMSHSGVDP